jgi:hypothetical protein
VLDPDGTNSIMSTTEHATPTTGTPISARINTVGSHLAQSLRSLLKHIPGQPSAAREMAQALSVDKILVHKLLSALRSQDPLATAHSIPGPEPLLRVVKAVKAKGAPIEAVRAAERAIASFKHLITHEAGDRSGLDAIISTLLPDARGRFETMAKQSVYRGMRQLKGLAADVTFLSFLVYPSAHGERCDFAILRGFLGLRCVRPGATMKIGVISSVANMDAPLLTLDGTPVGNPRDIVLSEFCSGPSAEYQVHEKAETLVFALGWGDAVGLRSACDIVLGEMRRNAMRRWRSPEDRASRTGVNDGISVPTRMYVFDLLLHEDVYPDWEPRARVFEMGELGLADPNDDSRDLDMLHLDVDVKPLGAGIEHFRAKEIPNYMEMLAHVCGKIGVSPERLRGYRTKIDHPVFGTHVQLAFDLPLAPAGRT